MLDGEAMMIVIVGWMLTDMLDINVKIKNRNIMKTEATQLEMER